jgi:hypothetical protein
MGELSIGNLIITTSVVIPHPNNVRLTGNISVSDLQYKHKTIRLHNYWGVERDECPKLKEQFLAHNRHLDEDDIQFRFEMIEYV